MIAGAPEHAPSGAKIDSVLNKFEKIARAGLERDRYTWATVQHREAGGGVHAHLVTAWFDLRIRGPRRRVGAGLNQLRRIIQQRSRGLERDDGPKRWASLLRGKIRP